MCLWVGGWSDVGIYCGRLVLIVLNSSLVMLRLNCVFSLCM